MLVVYIASVIYIYIYYSIFIYVYMELCVGALCYYDVVRLNVIHNSAYYDGMNV